MTLLLVASLWAGRASATTVVRASLEELTVVSAVVVHGVVRFVDDHLAVSPNGPFRTAIDIEVLESIKGLDREQRVLRLVLPGGRAFGRTMQIPGVPRFVPGDEVVLLLERLSRGGYALAGLSQGVFKIDRTGSEPTVMRSLRGIHLVERHGATSAREPLPRTLEGLLQRLHEVVGLEVQR